MSSELRIVLVVAGALAAVTCVLTIALLVKLAAVRRGLRSAGVPLENKTLFWGAVIYALCPVDLLPDPIFLDDIGLLLVALRALKSEAVPKGVRNHSSI
ncbi:DUF1232 domain-containing protein [Streptomyces sp. NPDC006368]|uniref:YkvA family protein n=1 Tax=Streptomyces sp. NPDC006368 TaxID=3156760 RepID=UPI0033AEC128